jgi:hypothetical protein
VRGAAGNHHAVTRPNRHGWPRTSGGNVAFIAMCITSQPSAQNSGALVNTNTSGPFAAQIYYSNLPYHRLTPASGYKRLGRQLALSSAECDRKCNMVKSQQRRGRLSVSRKWRNAARCMSRSIAQFVDMGRSAASPTSLRCAVTALSK